jgi:hypothetical protein
MRGPPNQQQGGDVASNAIERMAHGVRVMNAPHERAAAHNLGTQGDWVGKPRPIDGRVKIFDILKIRGSPSFLLDLRRHLVPTLAGWGLTDSLEERPQGWGGAVA